MDIIKRRQEADDEIVVHRNNQMMPLVREELASSCRVDLIIKNALRYVGQNVDIFALYASDFGRHYASWFSCRTGSPTC